MRRRYDRRRVPLEIGQKVAYNRSGDVVIGRIIGLGSTIKIMADPEFMIPTREWDPVSQRFDGPLKKIRPSRVRHNGSVLVLRQPDGEAVV